MGNKISKIEDAECSMTFPDKLIFNLNKTNIYNGIQYKYYIPSTKHKLKVNIYADTGSFRILDDSVENIFTLSINTRDMILISGKDGKLLQNEIYNEANKSSIIIRLDTDYYFKEIVYYKHIKR